MDPITLPRDIHLEIFSYLKPIEYLPLFEVSSAWQLAIERALKRRLWQDYAQSGEELDTYQNKCCVGSSEELKGRVTLFMKQLVKKQNRGVFICFFPLNESQGNIPWLAIKWNPKQVYNDSSDPIPMGGEVFNTSCLQAIQPYIQGKKFSEDNSKLAINVCFAVKKLKENSKRWFPITSKIVSSSRITADLLPTLGTRSITKVDGFHNFSMMFYTGQNPQEVHSRLFEDVSTVFSNKTIAVSARFLCVTFLTTIIFSACLRTCGIVAEEIFGQNSQHTFAVCQQDLFTMSQYVFYGHLVTFLALLAMTNFSRKF